MSENNTASMNDQLTDDINSARAMLSIIEKHAIKGCDTNHRAVAERLIESITDMRKTLLIIEDRLQKESTSHDNQHAVEAIGNSLASMIRAVTPQLIYYKTAVN